MGNTAVTYIRLVATGVIAGLAAVYPYNPSWYWITAVIAAGAAVGIHAIPAVGQSPKEVQAMSEQPNGRQLMGLDPQDQTGTDVPESEAITTEPEVTSEEAAETPQTGAVSPRQYLEEAVKLLKRAAEQL